MVEAADLLGNTIACIDGEVRIYAQRNRVAKFLKLPPPKRNKHQLLSALASVGWWRNSIPGFGYLTAPLFELTGPKQWIDDWGPRHNEA